MKDDRTPSFFFSHMLFNNEKSRPYMVCFFNLVKPARGDAVRPEAQPGCERRAHHACAALVAEQVNYKTLAESAEISQPTAKEWVRILQGLGIIYLLQPYANNELKRLTKTREEVIPIDSKNYFIPCNLINNAYIKR